MHPSFFYKKNAEQTAVPPAGSDDERMGSSTDEELDIEPSDDECSHMSDDDDDADQPPPPPHRKKMAWMETKSRKKPVQEPPWTGKRTLEMAVKPPYQYFSELFDKDLVDDIVRQSNLYARQKDIRTNFTADSDSIQRFMGACLYMGLYQMPGSKRYWSSRCGIAQVQAALSRKKFEELKRYLHFSDNSLNQSGGISKVAPLLGSVRKNLRKISMEQCLSVDEQVIPFKGRSRLKQYNPKKPKKWGYKMFVLCGASGIPYDFEFYAGKAEHPDHLTDISASSNVVLRLAQSVPQDENYRLFYDNWFSCPSLQVALALQGIQSLATVRPNRVSGVTMTSDKEMKKAGRGTLQEKSASVGNVQLKLVKWMDNRSVHLLSTFVGGFPTSQVQRWDKKTRQKVLVTCPAAVSEYNKFMGGVDLLDSLIALYRTRIRSKKYYMRIFFHMLDFVCVAAWLWYKRAAEDCHLPKKAILPLFEFKTSIAEALCFMNSQPRKRGRPSGESKENSVLQPLSMTNTDVTKDRVAHWPEYDARKLRCRQCHALTKVMCTKCNVHLCFVPERNCFVAYHC
ncbi:piggyBac transposable element-derived protein 3-like [Ornithodoros turicata]|uniref:piggyBac transposable element-derived protein 3-like n=1 Tax=Ornithodoros turicata TaxID=34597 RepID=UPI003138F80F